MLAWSGRRAIRPEALPEAELGAEKKPGDYPPDARQSGKRRATVLQSRPQEQGLALGAGGGDGGQGTLAETRRRRRSSRLLEGGTQVCCCRAWSVVFSPCLDTRARSAHHQQAHTTNPICIRALVSLIGVSQTAQDQAQLAGEQQGIAVQQGGEQPVQRDGRALQVGAHSHYLFQFTRDMYWHMFFTFC